MKQAIFTKYLGPTNTKGARVKAVSASGVSETLDWNHSIDPFDNHQAAVDKLRNTLGWDKDTRTIAGLFKVDGYVFVQILKE